MTQYEREIERIGRYLGLASHFASVAVERQARAILKKHTDLKEFVMGMGSWQFTQHDCRYAIDNDDSRVREFSEFIERFEDELHITGEPMRFTATGSKITNW